MRTNEKINILIIVNKLLVVCGVSKHLYFLLSGLKDREDVNIIVLCGGGDAIENFKNLGIKIIVFPNIAHENRTYLGFIHSVFFVKKLVKQYKINIIHSHHHYAANIAQAVKRFSTIKTLMTNHGILPKVGTLKHFPSDHIIAVNQYVVDFLVSQHVKPKENVHLIYHGLIPINNIIKAKNNKLKIIAASRITYEKGLDLYLEAVNLLPHNYKSKAEFYYAGEGNFLEEIKKLGIKLNSVVKYLGIIDDIQYNLMGNDVFILPTRSEALPISILEAALCKNLIITSDFLGLRHFFTPDEDGLTFEMNNYNSLSERIKYAIDNYYNLNFMIEKFHKKVKKMFNIEKMILSTVELYKEILK